MQRLVEPELLDELPSDDPRAIHSRTDLRMLNTLMRNVSHIATALAHVPAPRRVMDIGAGDGWVSLALARKLQWRNTAFILVDRNIAASPQTLASFQRHQCTATFRNADVLAELDHNNEVDVVVANLFLHHLSHEEIVKLLSAIVGRCAIFVACEPRRSHWALLASRCVGLLGCHAITRHDAVVSVRAGFRGKELSQLWPDGERWSLREEAVGAFSHRFAATRM
jgi:2-polyprenyl-3-methyl-5-hydroxy-6-metoxy-1,4-benzoquinol methylase